jgi:nucleoside-diphosphate-sugar epimerase
MRRYFRMRLFITGGTGFIGSVILPQALAAGHRIVALRRPGSRTRIPLAVEPDWMVGSLESVGVPALAGVDVVVHLAAHSANVPYDTLENCFHRNLVAPLRLFLTTISAGVNRFAVAGTCFEYGRSGERYERMPADSPLEPTQTYPASRVAASIAFQQLAIEHGLRFSIHRIFQVHGEGEAREWLWSYPVRAAEEVGSGLPQRLHDFAVAIWTEHRASGALRFGVKPSRSGEVMHDAPEI